MSVSWLIELCFGKGWVSGRRWWIHNMKVAIGVCVYVRVRVYACGCVLHTFGMGSLCSPESGWRHFRLTSARVYANAQWSVTGTFSCSSAIESRMHSFIRMPLNVVQCEQFQSTWHRALPKRIVSHSWFSERMAQLAPHASTIVKYWQR